MRKLSYSQVDLFRKCPKLWYHSYIVRPPVKPNPHFQFGSVVHLALENAINGKGFTITSKDLDLWDNADSMTLVANRLVEKALKVVETELPSGDRISEGKIDYPDFIGVIDLLIDKKHIIDFKTTSDIYSQHSVISHEQLTCYAWLYQRKYGSLPETLSLVTLDKKVGVARCYTTSRTDTDIELWKEKIRAVRFEIDNMLIYRQPNNCISPWGKCELYERCWESKLSANTPTTSKFGFID